MNELHPSEIEAMNPMIGESESVVTDPIWQ
jgi:hypothetical protein